MYTAKVIEEIDNGKGYWKSLKIGIFDKDENQIGEYKRNYSSFLTTFYPFNSRPFPVMCWSISISNRTSLASKTDSRPY